MLRRSILAAVGVICVVALADSDAKQSTSEVPYAFTSCFVDSDGDRIADCYETNTGVFISATNTGTDPTAPDTDGDGLKDGDEVYGTTAGLNLPSFGVSPVHKDVLLEYDWMADSTGCSGPHSHRPTPAMLSAVANAFANAPIANSDGTTGIRVYQDLSPSGNPNSESNFVADADGIIVGEIGDPDYETYMDNNFEPNRKHYFHWVLFAHSYNGSNSTGQATLGGDKMLITMGCSFADVSYVSKTIMHELGHNLNLNHGGPRRIPVGGPFNPEQGCNWKPNYNSVMNYKFQSSGVADCTMHAAYVADFSHGTRRTLDENNVYEPDGVCTLAAGQTGVPPIDWNHRNGIEYVVYAFDLNPSDTSCPNTHVLHDFDDWAYLDLPAFTTVTVEEVSQETAL